MELAVNRQANASAQAIAGHLNKTGDSVLEAHRRLGGLGSGKEAQDSNRARGPRKAKRRGTVQRGGPP